MLITRVEILGEEIEAKSGLFMHLARGTLRHLGVLHVKGLTDNAGLYAGNTGGEKSS